jgi:hypothetical protein
MSRKGKEEGGKSERRERESEQEGKTYESAMHRTACMK